MWENLSGYDLSRHSISSDISYPYRNFSCSEDMQSVFEQMQFERQPGMLYSPSLLSSWLLGYELSSNLSSTSLQHSY